MRDYLQDHSLEATASLAIHSSHGSYDRASEVSKLSEESDGYRKDIQDAPACLTDDHPQTCQA